MKLKPAGKFAILIVVLGLLFGAYKFMTGKGLLPDLVPGKQNVASKEVGRVDLPKIEGSAQPQKIENLQMPGESKAGSGVQVRWLLWAWNAQMGLMFANGGPESTQGSFMASKGINLKLERQDDVSKMQEALVSFATQLSRGEAQPTRGAHFVSIMGDGSAAFLAALNANLAKLGPEYTAKIVGTCGFSRGEDKFMGPAKWRDNPGSAKGGVVAGYLRDGDWNIALKWLGDNNLKNNPDETTYDPEALNWVAANDYIDAAEKYITGYTEERDVVRNGKRTGEKKRIRVDGVVTWTPGDVSIADKKGGIVSIVSTKEYSAQMPCVIIGIDKWMRANPEKVQGMLSAIFKGGDAVKQNADALRKAAEISAVVYNEKDASYWARYYAGSTEKDATGVDVSLGGSSVNNLEDNMLLFGRVPGSANTFAAVYRVFGDIVKNQYPDLMPSYPAVDQVLDTNYLDAVAKQSNFVANRSNPNPPTQPGNQGNQGKPTKPTKPTGRLVGNRTWDIKFDTGRATFTITAKSTLEAVMRELLVMGEGTIEIHGHTDNVGDPSANMKLSEARAFAVKKWLEARAPQNFGGGRVKVVAHGSTAPLAENTSSDGRARNRRVEIKTFAQGN